MSTQLITGYAGVPHVTSDQQGACNAATFTKGKYVLSIGSEFSYEVISNNLVRVNDGLAINQGRYMGIDKNNYEELTIDNGLQGVKRSDLIAIRYEKSSDSGTETATMVVIKGTSGDDYVDPEYNTGDILNGDLVDDFLLYRVNINGLSIESVDTLFKVRENMDKAIADLLKSNNDLIDEMEEVNNSLYGKLSFKNIATVKPGESVDITIPFNTAGFIVFNGASSTMQSFFQYFGFSNGIAGKTIGSQGTAVSYTMKSGTTNVLTVTNLSGGNGLIVDAIALRGDFPH